MRLLRWSRRSRGGVDLAIGRSCPHSYTDNKARSKPGNEALASESEGEETMTAVVAKDDLPCGTTAHKFEGHRYGDVDHLMAQGLEALPIR